MTHTTDKYILDGHTVVPCADLLVWGRWLEEHRRERIVKIEHLPGDYEVNTVFMGLEMCVRAMMGLRGAMEPGPVHVFETMVFSGFQRKGEILAQERCATWEEAEAMHERLARKYRAAVSS